jgi:hypothetical protein
MDFAHSVAPTTQIFDAPYFMYLSPLNLTLSVYIMIQNSMIIYDYYKDWTRVSSLLFILIAILDIGTAGSELGRDSMELLCLKDGSLRLPQWTYLTCFSFSVFCHVTSTFIYVVLTVVKTINIVNPFYRLKTFALKVGLSALLSMNFVLFISDAWNWNDSYVSHNNHPKCTALTGFWNSLAQVNSLGQGSLYNFFLRQVKISKETELKIYAIEMFLLFVQFYSPCLIVFVCMILQMVHIKRSFGRSHNPLQNTANQANLTVFLISMLYLCSVGTFSIYYLVTYITFLQRRSRSPVAVGPMFMLIRFTLPLLNAALFPTILILRKPDLRAKYWSYMLKVCSLPLTVFRRVSHHVQRRRGYEEI